MKIYRNIYIKYHDKLPKDIMQGRIVLSYFGKLVFKYDKLPSSYDNKQDMEITCDCDLEELKDIKKVEVK